MVDLCKLALSPDRLEDRPKWRPRALVEAERAAPYPVEWLPPLIQAAVLEVGSYTQAPSALIAASALSAVSAAVQTRYSVQRDAALTGPATLYLLTVAESGERKSTVDEKFVAPIREWEATQTRNHAERRARFKAETEDWERHGAILRDNIDSGHLAAQLSADALDPRVVHELARPKEPRSVRMLRGDDTPEALARGLEAYPVAAVVSAEAGVIFGSHGMSADAVTRNLAQANVMWDGGRIHQERMSRDAVRVEGMRVTMGLQVQPAVLEAFSKKTGGLAKGIGYFARFLFSQPESTQGGRFYVRPPADQPALRAFCHRMTTLLNVEAVFDEDDRLAPHLLCFDQAAQDAWEAFHDEVEEQIGGEERYAGIKDVASKAADNAARLACCFHVFNDDPSRPISQQAVLAACKLMRWYLEEAARFGRTRDAAPEVAHAAALEDWLVREVKRRGRAGSDVVVSVNEARQLGPNCLRGGGRLDAAVELLANLDRVRVYRRTGSKGLDMVLAPLVLAEYS